MKDLWMRIDNEANLPKRKGGGSYEQQDCLIVLHGEIVRAMWNCEHICWDREDGDDFLCNPMEPTHWQPLEAPES